MSLQLQEIRGIGEKTLERMISMGIDSIEKLASIKLEDLLKVNGIGKTSAINYIKIANKLLEEKKDKEKTEIVEEKSTNKILISEKKVVSKKMNPSENKITPKKEIISKLKVVKKQEFITKKDNKKKNLKKPIGLEINPFFSKELMQRIRFLHFKIKNLDEFLYKEVEKFNLDELNYILEYVRILNVNYKTQSQIKIFRELNITPIFIDPIDKREIKIWDLMFECARVLWVLAKIYAKLSNEYESENDLKNAIIAMVECSKVYKTAAYFSAACTRQEDMGTSLHFESLELNSEEARIFAQSIAASREENKSNFFLASKMYSGLSALSKRLFYLKRHDKVKECQLKAQSSYDNGKAYHLKAKALLKSSISKEYEEDIRKLQQKANHYFSKAEEIWENMRKNFKNLSKEELDINLSIVNENIIENDVEILDYNKLKNIQEIEPFIAVPENIAPFLPRTTIYLTQYVPENLEFSKFKEFKNKKFDINYRFSNIEKLLNKKAGIGRTIKELKHLYANNDININTFFDLLEKYMVELKKIESTIEKLKKDDKRAKTNNNKQIKNTLVN